MPLPNIILNFPGAKISASIAIFACNAFLAFLIIGSRSTAELVVNIASVVLVLSLSLLFLRSLFKCTHQHEEYDELTQNITSFEGTLAQMEKQRRELADGLLEKLGTPLEVIRGYSSMILDGTFGTFGEQARVMLDKIFHSSESIIVVAENLASSAKITDENARAIDGNKITLSQAWRIRMVGLRLSMVAATLALLAQILFATTFWNLVAIAIITALGVLSGFFLANEIKHEPESTDVLKKLTNGLNDIKERLETLEKEKVDFISRITTDMRKPLVEIMNDALHLGQGNVDEISMEARAASGKIFESSEHLIAVIADIVKELGAPAK